jgi:hypothetical protein
MTPLGPKKKKKSTKKNTLKGASGRTQPLLKGCSDIYVKFDVQANLEVSGPS